MDHSSWRKCSSCLRRSSTSNTFDQFLTVMKVTACKQRGECHTYAICYLTIKCTATGPPSSQASRIFLSRKRTVRSALQVLCGGAITVTRELPERSYRSVNGQLCSQLWIPRNMRWKISQLTVLELLLPHS